MQPKTSSRLLPLLRMTSAAALLAPVQQVAAQADSKRCGEGKQTGERTHLVSFQLENDLFAGTDSQYTSGVKLTWVSPNLTEFDDPVLKPWIRRTTDRFKNLIEWFLPADATACNMVITLGQAMYTPIDRDRTTLDPRDRPYAGWAYLGLGYNVRRDPPKISLPTLDTVEIDLGVVGPHSYAKETQDFVHRVRGFKRFLGWDNQLRDEPGIQIVWEQKYRQRVEDRSGSYGVDLIPHYGVSAGNIASYLNAGVEVRVGWRLPDDFGTSLIRPGGDNAAPWKTPLFKRVYSQQSFHTFVSIDARAVANNIFLDGNTLAGSHAVKKRILVGDIAYGWAYTWRNFAFVPSGKLAYAHYIQSREFEGEERNHGFGSVTLSLEF